MVKSDVEIKFFFRNSVFMLVLRKWKRIPQNPTYWLN